jgi:hypothetical protein
MQFTHDGPDIPNDLIQQQELGKVVFICGAGVSRGVGLPSFKDLVVDIYKDLNESWGDHPAEAAGMNAQALDRTLFALQIRIGGDDPKSSRAHHRRVVEAVQRRLKAPEDESLQNHLNLLRLSRGLELDERLVTTNFDTLFERAWFQHIGAQITSHAVGGMPAPGSSDFAGIMHLHGRIEDTDLSLSRSDLILTSAEFGEAYLRSGWASRYLYDLARTATIVVVGYGVDDPPLRYMFEVLTADRNRFPDLKEIYAFVDWNGTPEDESLKASLWKARGTKPILYKCTDSSDHSCLYDALQEWTGYADDPTAWHIERAGKILAKRPEEVEDHEWQQLCWALDRQDGGRILADINPEPNWLGPLRAKGLFTEKYPSAWGWIEQRMLEREMLTQVIKHFAVTPVVREGIHWQLQHGKVELTPAFRKAWQLVANIRQPRPEDGLEWYPVKTRLEQGDQGIRTRSQIVDLLKPKAIGRPSLRWPNSEAPNTDRVKDLIDIEFEPAQHFEIADFLKLWPADRDGPLLRDLSHALLEALEEASDYGQMDDGYDRPNSHVKSIAAHGEDQLRRGFYLIVRIIADLWSRLARVDATEARAIAVEWSRSRYNLPRRLHLFALTSRDAFTPSDAAVALLDLDAGLFWKEIARREVMLLTTGRWSEFSADERGLLSKRILIGMPRNLFGDLDAARSKLFDDENDRVRYDRLIRIRETGGQLDTLGADLLDGLQKQNPEWVSRGEGGDFSFRSGVRWVGRGDPTLLDGIAVGELAQEAHRLMAEKPLYQREVWRQFTSVNPRLAFNALIASDAGARIDFGALWTQFFWALDDLDEPELQADTLNHMLTMDLANVPTAAHAIASWLKTKYALLADLSDGPAKIRVLLSGLFELQVDQHANLLDAAREQPIDHVLNSVGGVLASILINEIGNRTLEPGAGLPVDLEPLATKLVTQSGYHGFVAKAAFIQHLTRFYFFAPEWTRANLLPQLEWTSDNAEGMWRARSEDICRATPALFSEEKAAFLQAFRRSTLSPHLLEELIRRLLDIADINCSGSVEEHFDISFLEIKAALASQGSEGIQDFADEISRKFRIMKEKGEPTEGYWKNTAKPIIQNCWPPESALQTQYTVQTLFHIVQNTGDAFPDAVTTALPMLRPLISKNSYETFWQAGDENKDLLTRFPKACLLLLSSLYGEANTPQHLGQALTAIVAADAEVAKTPAYRRLLGFVRRASAE